MSNNQEKLNLQLLNVIKSKSKDFETKLKKVKYLIRLGADVNAKLYGKSILSWAVIDGNIEPSITLFLKEKGAEEFEISKEEADRLASLVCDVLDLSKIRSGLSDFKTSPVDMSEKVKEILDRFAYLKDAQGYRFETDVEKKKETMNYLMK